MTTTVSAEPSAPQPVDNRAGFGELMREVKATGLLERRPRLYALRIATTVAMMVAGWTAFFILGNSWWQLLVGAFLAFTFAQAGFLGHDAGHRQIFPSKKANDVVMLLAGNLGIGVASGWWSRNHAQHHAHPNNTELDPDVQIRLLSYTAKQAGEKSGLHRFTARYQNILFFPFLAFEAFSLHVESAVVVLRNQVARRKTEGALLLAHFVLYGAALVTVLPLGKLIAFVLIHQMLFGLYLGSTFAPNHKGMDMNDGDEDASFLHRQVLTSRNVRGGMTTAYLLGGLNYQIEHHLFPSMPRPNLARVQPIVKRFCADHQIPFAETSLFDSFGQVLRHFKTNRAPAS